MVLLERNGYYFIIVNMLAAATARNGKGGHENGSYMQ